MTNEDSNISKAKRSVKQQIHLLKTLLKNLNGTDERLRLSALATSWCLNQYFNAKLPQDVDAALREVLEEIKKAEKEAGNLNNN